MRQNYLEFYQNSHIPRINHHNRYFLITRFDCTPNLTFLIVFIQLDKKIADLEDLSKTVDKLRAERALLEAENGRLKVEIGERKAKVKLRKNHR